MKTFKKHAGAGLAALTLAIGITAAPDAAEAQSMPYLGEVSMKGLTSFCPTGWAEANGQLLPVAQYDALFSLLGTNFGGDGRTTFGLPDLRGRTPIGSGQGPGLANIRIGNKYGAEEETLEENQLARHRHTVRANNLDGDKPGPGGKLLAAAPPGGAGSETIYSTAGATVTMSSEMITYTGSGAPIPIIDPTAVIRYCIALQGVYPSRH